MVREGRGEGEPLTDFRKRAYKPSTFAAKIKSPSLSPPIKCVHSVSFTWPHARKMSGW